MKHLPYIVILALVLLLAWAKDLKDQGVADERERGFVKDIQRLTRRADSLSLRYVVAKAEADSAGKIARAAVRRRGRVVASSDSVLARVDSALSTHPEQPAEAPLARLLTELRAATLAERASSDSAISSLLSTVDAKNLALSASDSVIASLQERIGAQNALIQELTRRAHPPLWKQAVRAAKWVGVGVVAGMLVR